MKANWNSALEYIKNRIPLSIMDASSASKGTPTSSFDMLEPSHNSQWETAEKTTNGRWIFEKSLATCY